MTVIVYKDGVMAADTATFRGPFITSTSAHKVVRLHGALVGCSGDAQNIDKFHQWIALGLPEHEKPALTGGEEDFGAIVVFSDGTIREFDHTLASIYCTMEPFVHEGEGYDFAFALHTLGWGAEQIVAHAIKHCVWAAGEVYSLRLEEFDPEGAGESTVTVTEEPSYPETLAANSPIRRFLAERGLDEQ